MIPMIGGEVSRSMIKWVVAVVVSAILGLASFAITGTVKDLKAKDVVLEDRTTSLERGDGRYETRITLLESHYLDIHDELKDIHAELRQLNERRPRSYSDVRSGRSTYPDEDVLNGLPNKGE